MEEIKVNEYVRTKTGNITKVISVKNTVIWTEDFIDVYCRYNEGIIEKTDIKKHSPNIIDLIEEDDIGIMRYKGLIFKKFITKDDILELKFKNYELLEIVTKEMFNQVKYEV